MSRLAQRLAAGQMAIGTLDTLGSSRLVEVMAFAGLDMILIDQMFCPADWETVAGMVRSARNFGVDTMVRVAGFPWAGKTDHRQAVDAVRALGVGATGVMISCATVEEVEELVEVSKDWHRDIHIHAFGDEDFAQFSAAVSSECAVMPMIESESALRDIDKIMDVPGLKYLDLGMTDLSRMVGQPFNYEHPDVEAVVKHVVERGHSLGIAIGGNLGYQFSRSIEDMSGRAARMAELGFDFLWLQNNGFVIQWMYRSVVKAMEASLPNQQNGSNQSPLAGLSQLGVRSDPNAGA